ncbi:MAG: hypothetical protein AAGA30_09045 [Planctomycetota bacterium]
MTDDIFDYFGGGGSSPKKLEPIEADDLFEDLLPKKSVETSSDTTSEGEDSTGNMSVVDDQNDLGDADESTDESAKPAADERPKKTESSATQEPAAASANDDKAIDSWGMLASSLGLEATPTENNANDHAESVASEAIEIIEDVELVETNNVELASGGTEDFFDLESSSSADEGSEVLSELFVARDHEEFEESSIDLTDKKNSDDDVLATVDDDPFAAFHAPSTKKSEENVEQASDELASDTDEDDSAGLVVDDNFVEFDVKDFGSGGASDDSSGHRRKKRRNQRRPDNDSSERAPRQQGRRGRKRRSENTDSGRSESGRSEREQFDNENEEVRTRKPRSRSRTQNDRERNRSEEHDDSQERVDNKKKPKIPTWEDAIGGVVEKNIRRHRSNSGRGGKRRRN